MESKSFLKEHYITQILLLSEHRETVLKQLLEKPRSNGYLALYNLLTGALSETETKLSMLDGNALWEWCNVIKHDPVYKEKWKEESEKTTPEETENVFERGLPLDDIPLGLDEEETESVILDEDDSEHTTLLAEVQIRPIEDGYLLKEGAVLDVNPSSLRGSNSSQCILVLIVEKDCWRVKAQKDEPRINLPLYKLKEEQIETIKKSLRGIKGHKHWVQTESKKFGAYITATKDDYKWGVFPKDSGFYSIDDSIELLGD